MISHAISILKFWFINCFSVFQYRLDYILLQELSFTTFFLSPIMVVHQEFAQQGQFASY